MLDNFGCTKCGLCKNRKNIVNGYGPKDAKIVVVGEGPGLQEDAKGFPFVGPSGLLLRRMMQQAGIDYRQVYFTNIVRCLPKSEDPKKQVRAPTYEEMDICTPYLEQELTAIKPTIIVPAGNVALRYFLEQKNKNITSHRGLEIWSEKYNCKIMPVYHPAAVIRNPKFESVTVQDLIRINNSQTSKEPTPLGLGNYVVADTKEKLDELFHYLSTEPEFVFDLETTDLDWLTSEIISIGFCWKERTGWCLPILKSKLDPSEPTTRFWDDATHLKVMSELKRIFALPSKKVAHNCFYFNTPVILEDGTSKSIHEIVTDRYSGKVLSYNIASGKIEPKKITGWSRFIDEHTRWLQIIVEGTKYNKKGNSGLVLTPDHKVYTSRGYISAENIKKGDRILLNSSITDLQFQLILGSLFGDGSLVLQKAAKARNPYFKVSHSDKQLDYLNTKKDILGKLIKNYRVDSNETGFNTRKGALLHSIRTPSLPHLKELYSLFYKKGKKSVSLDCLNLLDERGIAFWYMDDGCYYKNTLSLATASFSYEENQLICSYFKKRWGIFFRISEIKNENSSNILYRLVATGENINKFFSLIQEYVHPSFQYKLREQFLAKGIYLPDKTRPMWATVEEVNIFDGDTIPSYKNVQYCIEVEDNHNFFARNLLVSNSKFDQKFLVTNGIEVNNMYFDTMLAHHLLDENAEGLHGLKDLAWVYTDMGGYEKEVNDYFSANKKLKRQFIMLPFSILTKYNAADADCTFRLYKKFEPLINQQGLLRLYKQVISPTREVLLQAELDGVQVDQDYVEKLRAEYSHRKGLLEKEIFKLTGTFNINSSLELRGVLYDKLKFKATKQTKKGALSTDREALANIAKAYPQHLVPKFLLEYRECTKMLSTFIEGLTRHIDKNGRVHSTYKQHGTVTGRLSSSEPNLQNIPRESTIRGIFVSRPGYSLVEADYGQAEFRFWAFYSQDPQMIYDLKTGQDIHKMTAASAWGIPMDKVTKTQRQNAKAIVFGLMYGRGTWSVAQQLGISEDEAEKIVNIFFARYPIAKRWLKQQVQLAKRQGYVTNYFGRIRRLPGINSNDNLTQSEAERQAKNSPIQSGASDMTCIAGIRIKKRLADEGLKGKLVLTVHDSLVYECPNDEVDQTINIIKEETERPIGEINVPMICELKKGTRWGFLEEVQVLV